MALAAAIENEVFLRQLQDRHCVCPWCLRFIFPLPFFLLAKRPPWSSAGSQGAALAAPPAGMAARHACGDPRAVFRCVPCGAPGGKARGVVGGRAFLLLRHVLRGTWRLRPRSGPLQASSFGNTFCVIGALSVTAGDIYDMWNIFDPSLVRHDRQGGAARYRGAAGLQSGTPFSCPRPHGDLGFPNKSEAFPRIHCLVKSCAVIVILLNIMVSPAVPSFPQMLSVPGAPIGSLALLLDPSCSFSFR